MSTTPNLGLTLLDPGQNQKEVTVNTDLTSLDTLLQAFVAANNGKLIAMASGHSTALGLGAPLAISGGNLTLGLPADAAKYLDGTGNWTVPGGAGGGTVTSVALSMPGIFSVSGSPITTSGTLNVTLATQVANTVLAGPATGADAAPTFRALAAADLPAVSISAQGACPTLPNDAAKYLNGVGSWATPAGSGTVTSVALSMPAVFSVSGSPITSSGTLNVTLATQVANTVLAGPATGADAAPTFRALVAADLPAVTTSAQGACPTLPNDAAKYLNGLGNWATPGGGGTVTSAALTMPAIFAVSGSPITSSGTFAVTLENQNANLVFAGPASGSAAAPSFRSLAAKDIPVAPTVTDLTDAATIATDASLGNHFRVTLGGNRTLGNPTNPTNGQRCIWEIIQDATGSRTLALDTKFALGTDITSTTLTTTASKRDFLGAIYNSTADKWYVVAFVKGY